MKRKRGVCWAILGALLAGVLAVGFTACNTFGGLEPLSTDRCDVDERPVVCPGVDLRGADLRGADLRGADLQGADLQGADLQDAQFEGANLDDVHWSRTICPDGTLSGRNGGTCGGHLGEAICGMEPDRTTLCPVGMSVGTCGACDVRPDTDCRCANENGSDWRYAQLSNAKLQHTMEILLETDRRLKSSRLKDQVLLERMVVEVCI